MNQPIRFGCATALMDPFMVKFKSYGPGFVDSAIAWSRMKNLSPQNSCTPSLRALGIKFQNETGILSANGPSSRLNRFWIGKTCWVHWDSRNLDLPLDRCSRSFRTFLFHSK